MNRPTIRRTLIALFLLLGAALCLAVGVQVAASVSNWREARALAQSNLARESLALAFIAVAEERTLAYLLRPHAEERAVTDAALDRAGADLASLDDAGTLRSFQALRSALSQARQVADAGQGLPAGMAREASAAHVLATYTDLTEDLLTIRLALLAREDPTDQVTASAFQARRYASLVLEGLSLERALVERLATGADLENEAALLGQVARTRERTTIGVEFLQREARIAFGPLRAPLDAFVRVHATNYRSAERRLLDALQAGPPPPEVFARWAAQSRRAMEMGVALLEELFDISRTRIEDQRQRALRVALVWTALLVLGIAAVIAGMQVVIRRVVRPLDDLRGSMLALAGGDLQAPLPEQRGQDEIGVMVDTLRVFKANAIRRARLQDERLALHDRLQEAYRQLRSDLDSAAAVQASLLPAPGRIGGVRFTGRLRPSHGISGDSFDVLRQPNGAVHFFLIDVAGHGAAAALVSVASHYMLTEAVLRRPANESLAETAASLNRNWPAHLPYFTMVLGELLPEQGSGSIVQAGHPPPLLLRRADGVEPLGQGGLPIGVLPEAEFEEIRFDFGPGDRLLLYSDGLTEAEDADGRPFGEERLLDIVRDGAGRGADAIIGGLGDAVRRWRGSDDLDDDMTMLILEGIDDEDDGRVPRRRAAASAA